jgi:hypothetical protein
MRGNLLGDLCGTCAVHGWKITLKNALPVNVGSLYSNMEPSPSCSKISRPVCLMGSFDLRSNLLHMLVPLSKFATLSRISQTRIRPIAPAIFSHRLDNLLPHKASGDK